MKRLFIVLIVMINVMTALCQSFISTGDICFDKGDYNCAISNYEMAFKNSNGKDKQMAEIKLTRAKWCADHLILANQAFTSKKYLFAKEEYQKVLDSNPKDDYSKTQILKCENELNPPKLRKATISELTDIWENKYGVNPERRQKLIAAGIDPDDAQKRINAGEGKPVIKEEIIATYLNVSKTNLFFTSYGETSEQLVVYTDARSYSIPSNFLPSWCFIQSFNGYFKVTVAANPDYTKRKDWFLVAAGGKEVKVYVEQAGKPNMHNVNSSNLKLTSKSSKNVVPFNSPKTNNILGIAIGYSIQEIGNTKFDIIQIGFKVEPLFRYGLGLNTGINVMGYTNSQIINGLFQNGFETFLLNIPLQLEYRVNFSKWFNFFAYGGVGFNYFTKTLIKDLTYPFSLEYGLGLRINRIQVTLGKSFILGDLGKVNSIGQEISTFQSFNSTLAYMF